mmetsp:Transcript_21166/g.49647  ORF Transcript_21166/g.49647 Transcript_21166/m.49647 type:complete len:99 (+) Transcript_21166:225-521(+)
MLILFRTEQLPLQIGHPRFELRHPVLKDFLTFVATFVGCFPREGHGAFVTESQYAQLVRRIQQFSLLSLQLKLHLALFSFPLRPLPLQSVLRVCQLQQ